MFSGIRKRPESPIETGGRKKPKKVDISEKPSDNETGKTDYETATESTSESSEELFLDPTDINLEKLEKEDPVAFANFKKVEEEITKSEPDLLKILKTPMRLEDRVKLFQYYEIYKNQEPNTEEWINSRDFVNKLFKDYQIVYKQHCQYNDKQHEKMEDQAKKFTNYNTQINLKYKILNLETSDNNKEVIYRRYEEYTETSPTDDQYGKLRNWLSWATDLPYDKLKIQKITDMSKLLKKAADIMNKELYGMEKVKEQILLFINAKLTNPTMKKCNLGLIGPPGSGKTSIAKLIAKLMDLPFEQISFGGIDKPDYLKGHEYTYIGSQPGEIVRCMKRMGYKNGILFLDEYEKISDNKDICSALLHITDPTQNNEFRDNFLADITIDLSDIWFIYSMNSAPSDDALNDRIFTIEVPGYSYSDKIKIIEEYLLPKCLKNCSLEVGNITLAKGAAGYIINKVSSSHDGGVRSIEKAIADIVNKVNFIVTYQDKKGNIPFDISFKINQKLSYPLVLDNIMLEKILISKETNKMIQMMYI